MARRTALAFPLALAVTMALALPAAAGGWAEARLDSSRTTADGGGTIVRFTLLQHGVTPVDWGTTQLTALRDETGESVTVSATPVAEEPGTWTATLQLPSAGAWSVSINHQDLEVGFVGPMSIEVAAAPGATAPVADPRAGAVGLALALTAALAMLLVGGAAMREARRRRRGGAPSATGLEPSH